MGGGLVKILKLTCEVGVSVLMFIWDPRVNTISNADLAF